MPIPVGPRSLELAASALKRRLDIPHRDQRLDDQLELHVRDEGEGFPPEFLPQGI